MGNEWRGVLIQKSANLWECLDEDVCHVFAADVTSSKHKCGNLRSQQSPKFQLTVPDLAVAG